MHTGDDDDTQILCTFYNFLYLLLPRPLLSLSPHSVITNLHTFHALPYSFLLVAGLWLSYCCRYCRKSKCSYAFSEISCFYDWKKNPAVFGVWIRILRDTGTEPFKYHKTGTVHRKLGRTGSLLLRFLGFRNRLVARPLPTQCSNARIAVVSNVCADSRRPLTDPHGTMPHVVF